MPARTPWAAYRLGFSAVILLTCARVSTLQAQQNTPPPEQKAETDPILRDYLSGNGLLNRGLYELASKEYRKFLDAHADHAKSPLARYGLGVSLFRLDRPADAEVEFKKIASTPFEFSTETLVLLGRCQLAGKKYKDAAASFQGALDKQTDRPIAADAAAGLIEALYLSEKHDDVLAACVKYTEKWPGSQARDRIIYFSGLSRISKGDHAAATADFRKLAEGKGALSSQARLLLAQSLQQSSGLDESIECFQKIINSGRKEDKPAALAGLALSYLMKKQAQKSVSTYDRLIREFPDSPAARSAKLSRAQALFTLEKFDAAIAGFKKIDEHEPVADAAAYWSAKCLLRMGKNADAAESLEIAIGAFPASKLLPEMMFDRGVAIARDKKNDEAIAIIKEFRAKFPKHILAPDALDFLATLTHQSGDFAASEEYCRTFARDYPKHSRSAAISFLAAENLFLRNDFDKAATAFREFIDAHPDDAQISAARARMGLALYKTGKTEEAQQALASIADQATGEDSLRPVLLALGDLAFDRGEWKNARKFLSDYLKQEDAPSADDAMLKIGLSHQRESNFADAIKSFERLIEKYPKSPHRLQALFEKGQALTELSRGDEAVTAFDAVLKTDPNSRFAPYALNHLAEIALGKGDMTKAAELFDQVASAGDEKLRIRALDRQSEVLMTLKQFAEAQSSAKKLLKLKPDQKTASSARARIAIAEARQDHRSKALELIDEALATTTEVDIDLKTSLLYEKAWCLRGEKKPAEAARAYEELLAVAKTGELHSRALLEFAEIQSDSGKFDRAAALLRQIPAGKDAPADASLKEQAAYRLAVSLVNLKKHDEAGIALAEFIKGNPESVMIESASLLCGDSFFLAGKFEKALDPLKRATRAKDKKISNPARLRLGEAYASLNRWSESESIFQEYLDRSPEDAQAYQARFGLAWAMENLGRHEQAIAAYRRVIEKHQGPTAARAQFQIGECLFATKKYEDAAAELLKVDILYAYPEWSAAALYEAGRCFEALDKNRDARKQYEVVVEKFKDTRWAKLALDRLAQARTANVPGRS
jgi:TolA-binding protein